MTLQQLLYFREVAHELHFSRAADNLYVAQSSLSHSIQELESEIGAPLFLRRNGKKIQLTTYGKAFLPYVERVLLELDSGKNELEQMISPNCGVARIAYSYTNGCGIMADLLNAFYDVPSNADISIRQVVNHGGKAFIEDVLALCEADIAISTWPFTDSPHIQSTKIAEQEQYVLLPNDHPLASKEMVSVQELKDDNIIMFSGAYGLYDYTVDLFRGNGIDANFVDGFTDWSTVIMEVARGNGIAILPYVDIFSENIVCVKLDDPNNTRDLFLLWPADRKLSKTADAVRKFILEYFNA